MLYFSKVYILKGSSDRPEGNSTIPELSIPELSIPELSIPELSIMIYSTKQQYAIDNIIDRILLTSELELGKMYVNAEYKEEYAIRHGQDPYKAVVIYYESLLKIN